MTIYQRSTATANANGGGTITKQGRTPRTTPFDMSGVVRTDDGILRYSTLAPPPGCRQDLAGLRCASSSAGWPAFLADHDARPAPERPRLGRHRGGRPGGAGPANAGERWFVGEPATPVHAGAGRHPQGRSAAEQPSGRGLTPRRGRSPRLPSARRSPFGPPLDTRELVKGAGRETSETRKEHDRKRWVGGLRGARLGRPRAARRRRWRPGAGEALLPQAPDGAHQVPLEGPQRLAAALAFGRARRAR